MSDQQESKVLSAQFHAEFVRVGFAGNAFKNVAWEDFINEFDNIFKREIEKVKEKPKPTSNHVRLPVNAFIMEEDPKKGTMTVSMYFPESTVDLQFDKGRHVDSGEERYITFKDCPLPNIIVTATLLFNKKTDLYGLQACKYFCTSRRLEDIEAIRPILEPERSKQIWPLALPNMYDGGNMCYGGNSTVSSIPKDDLRSLEWQYHLVFQSPFNNDLSVPGQSKGMNGRTWLNHISKEKDGFPYWDLYDAPWSKAEYLRDKNALNNATNR